MRALLVQLRKAAQEEAESGRVDADEARALVRQIDALLDGEETDHGSAVANLREALRLSTGGADHGQDEMVLRLCKELLGALPGDPTTDPD